MTGNPEKLITGEELLESMLNAHQSLSVYRSSRNPRSGNSRAREDFLENRDAYLELLSSRAGFFLTAKVINPVENPKKPLAGPILTTNRTLRSLFGLRDSGIMSSPDAVSGFLQDSDTFSSSLELTHPGKGLNRPLHSVVSLLNPLTLEPLVSLHFADES